MCCILYSFTHSFMKSLIQIALAAEFGASVSLHVHMHVHLDICVLELWSQKRISKAKRTACLLVSLLIDVSFRLALCIKLKQAMLLFFIWARNPETHIISSDSVTAKNFPLVFPSKALKSIQTKELKKTVLKTSMSTQSNIMFLWVYTLENILKSRSSLVSALMRCYLGWLTRLQRTELFLQLTPSVKCANKLHGPTWVPCRQYCRYYQSA